MGQPGQRGQPVPPGQPGDGDRWHVAVVADGHRHDLTLIADDPHATIADVEAAVHRTLAAGGPAAPVRRREGTGTAGGITIDGRRVASHRPVRDAGLVDGCEVVLGAGPLPVVPPTAGSLLAATDGPVAGHAWPLDGDPVTLGRSPDADVVLDDPTVSGHHAAIVPVRAPATGGPGVPVTFTVRDLGSCNGTWIDDVPVLAEAPLRPGQVLRLGATHLRLSHVTGDAVDAHPATAAPTVPVNRPPRPLLPPMPPPVDLPSPPTPAPAGRSLSVVSIVAPLLLAGGLVVWTGNARFALFLLLSPVLAIGTWWSARRQARRHRRDAADTARRALASLRHDLDVLVDAEVARRRRLLPDVAEVVRRIHAPSRRLWERRPEHDDHLWLRVGVGTVPWEPPVRSPAGGRGDAPVGADMPAPSVARVRSSSDAATDEDRHAAAIAAQVRAASRLPRCPVAVDLARGGVVGIVGDRGAGRSLARSLLLQTAVHHGPADLAVVVVAEPAAPWTWARWLPHARWEPDAPAAPVEVTQVDEVVARWRAQEAGAPRRRTLVVVVDDARFVHGRGSTLRTLLAAADVAGIVLAERPEHLPAHTTAVVTVHGPHGDGELHRPGDGHHVDDLVIGGLDQPTAERAARGLARFDDPDRDAASGLPAQVRLAPLLGIGDDPVATVLTAWAEQPADPAPAAPIGLGSQGVVDVDLVADGPHGLLVGTTGSGKSELLRSLVVGLAARVDPDHLTFVLIDYKGGSAFDGCAALPHTVGVVTDLDGHLGERALRSLDAEVRHRERLLREAGASDLPAYLRAGAPLGALPRLVVVVDEFATLAAQLPDLLDALVGLAQRGRSLGIHLLLATQRPGGALNASITANTDLRIALRVQDAGDAVEVIGSADAASVPRSLPGRGYLRTGRMGTVAVQTALVTGPTPDRRWPVRAVPFAPSSPGPSSSDVVSRSAGAATASTHPAAGDVTGELDRLVTAIVAAFARTGAAAPRRPWLPPLPDVIDRDDVEVVVGSPPDATRGVVLGVADDPDRQCRVPVTWHPCDGHLAVLGTVGSGTTTALRSLAVALAQHLDVDTCHVHAVELAPGGLAEVATLPNVGTYAGPGQAPLRQRLLRHLRRELDRRRGLSATQMANEPWTVVLIDGIGALLADLDAADAGGQADAFRRVIAEGPALRIVVALAGARAGELPLRHATAVGTRLLLRHADPQELASCGLRAQQLPRFVPGRAVTPEGMVVQLARPGRGHAGDGEPSVPVLAGAPAVSGRTGGPVRLRELPDHLDVTALSAPRADARGLRLPIALAEEDLATLELVLPAGGHALVAGPPRSGVSSTLTALALQARRADEDAVLVGICAPGSALYDSGVLDAAGPLDDLVDVVAAATTDRRRWVVLVDRAPGVADVAGRLTGLVAAGRDDVHVVAGGRADDLRSGYAHWARDLRAARCGVLLRPDPLVDGEVVGASLPRRVPVALDVPGRGFVVTDGVAALAQVAAPPSIAPRCIAPPPIAPRGLRAS